MAGPLAPEQGREDSRVGVHASRYVRDRVASLRRNFGRAGNGDEAGLALDEQVIGFLVPVGARRTVARDVADYEPGTPLSQSLRPEAEPSGRARREVLDEDVGPLEQAVEDLAGSSFLRSRVRDSLERLSHTKWLERPFTVAS